MTPLVPLNVIFDTLDVISVPYATPVRVVVADAHRLFTLGVRVVLSAEPNITIVGEAADGEHTLRLLDRLRPDLLLLDLALERITGLEVLARMAPMKLDTRTVVVTAAIETSQLRTALTRGARGVLVKHVAGEHLLKCVRQVMKGEYWVSRDNVGDLVDALRKSSKRPDPGSALSQRERDIVNAVLKGASNKDIAWQLGLGEQTIKNHLRRIFAKLGVTNRVELAVHTAARQLADEGDSERLM